MQLPDSIKALFTRGVTDVMFVGAENCFIDSAIAIEQVQSPFSSDEELQRLLIELALAAGARLDLAKPTADFAIENFRFSAQLASAVSEIPLATIRRHPRVQITFEHLLNAALLSDSQAGFLDLALQKGKSLLISGPTSVGKTTLLSALIHASKQRCIVIEQTPELWVAPPSVKLVERPNNQQGVGLISQSELLTQALRMRPDRLVVGEIRGAEFASLLQAVNNGHPAMATIHSRSIEEVPRRLELLGQLAQLPTGSVANLALGIDFVLHLERIAGERKLTRIGKFANSEKLEVVAVEV